MVYCLDFRVLLALSFRLVVRSGEGGLSCIGEPMISRVWLTKSSQFLLSCIPGSYIALGGFAIARNLIARNISWRSV